MDFSDILGAIIVGAIVGVLGRLALPGRQRIGAFVTLLIGVGAAFLGTYLADRFSIADKAPQTLWFLRWDWLVLGIQVPAGAALTGGRVELDGMDVTAFLLSCFQTGSAGGGQTFSCPIPGNTLPPGDHTLQVELNLSNQTRIRNAVRWSVIQ